MALKARTALTRPSSSSSLEPNSISYRFIRAVRNTALEDILFKEIGEVQITGQIPHEWQNSKVVMIPNSEKTILKSKNGDPLTSSTA